MVFSDFCLVIAYPIWFFSSFLTSGFWNLSYNCNKIFVNQYSLKTKYTLRGNKYFFRLVHKWTFQSLTGFMTINAYFCHASPDSIIKTDVCTSYQTELGKKCSQSEFIFFPYFLSFSICPNCHGKDHIIPHFFPYSTISSSFLFFLIFLNRKAHHSVMEIPLGMKCTIIKVHSDKEAVSHTDYEYGFWTYKDLAPY